MQVLFMAVFVLKQQSWVAGTETVNPKISTIWSFKKKFANSFSNSVLLKYLPILLGFSLLFFFF